LSETRTVKIAQYHNEQSKLVTTVVDAETGEVLYSVEMDSSQYEAVRRMIADIAYSDAIGFIYGSGYTLKGGGLNDRSRTKIGRIN